jgi:hypothetical protein
MDGVRGAVAQPRVFASLVIVASGLLALSLTTPVRAADIGRAPVLCTFEVHDTSSPGWMMTPSRGTGHSTGILTCIGVVNGRQLADKPGQLSWRYSYGSADVPFGGNTCALNGGSGTWEATLPTVQGPAMTLTGRWWWEGNVSGGVHGFLDGRPVEMVYEAFPEPEHLDEDCTMKPVSHLHIIGQGTIG